MAAEDIEEVAASAEMRDRERIELLVRRVIAEQNHGAKPEPKPSLWKHPAFLLALTFILTGVFGSLLTSCWQAQEWARGQSVRVADEATKEREAVLRLTTESVAESFTAAEDVLHLFAWNWTPYSPVVRLKERSAQWAEASTKWRVAEKLLLARVQASYTSQPPQKLLDDIVSQRRELGVDIQNLLSLADAGDKSHHFSAKQEEEIDGLLKHAMEIINKTTGRNGTLEQLVQAMIAETRANQATIDTTIWTILGRSVGLSR